MFTGEMILDAMIWGAIAGVVVSFGTRRRWAREASVKTSSAIPLVHRPPYPRLVRHRVSRRSRMKMTMIWTASSATIRSCS
jgi:hypothetical protein